MEEAARRTEEERRESVRLMEMLRTARILCNAAGKEKATETESEIVKAANRQIYIMMHTHKKEDAHAHAEKWKTRATLVEC